MAGNLISRVIAVRPPCGELCVLIDWESIAAGAPEVDVGLRLARRSAFFCSFLWTCCQVPSRRKRR